MVQISFQALFSVRPVHLFEKSIAWWNGTSDHTLFLGHLYASGCSFYCTSFFFLSGGESGREGGKDEVFASTDVNETGTYSH